MFQVTLRVFIVIVSDQPPNPLNPASDIRSDALSAGDELLLQQLLQVDFWQKRREAQLDAEPVDQPASVNTQLLPQVWELIRGVTLHDWQTDCVNRWFAAEQRGVIKVVTGAGKTILALAIAQELQRRSIPDLRLAIVVPTVVLLEQWKEEFLNRSNLPSTALGFLGSGHDDAFNDQVRVMVCVLNSAAKKLPELVKDSGIGSSLLLIVDECHRAGSGEMQKVFRTERRASLGLSATPEREQDSALSDDLAQEPNDVPLAIPEFADTILGRELGPVIFELNYAEAIQLSVLPPFSIRHYGLSLTAPESVKYERISREIKDLRKELERPGRQGLGLIRWCRSSAAAGNPSAARLIGLTSERKRLLFHMEERANAVLQLVRTAFSEAPDTKAILFHESIGEVMRLFGLLRAEGFPVVAEHSEFSDQMRANSLRLFRNGTARIIVSARSLIEGFNVPSADFGIIVAASSSVRQRVQTLGRLLRKSIQAGTEKHAVLHVLYASKTVDELIYEKADWNQFVGAERNSYFLWPKVENTTPQPMPAGPRAPAPTESAVQDQTLRPGDTYLGNLDEGVGLTRDTQGNIRTEEGGFIAPNPMLLKILTSSKRTAGRFRVTPLKGLVIELEKENDTWRGVYLGQLNERVKMIAADQNEAVPTSLSPGDPYPLSRVTGKNYSVLQRDQRLIAEKKIGQIRFVPPLDNITDPAKRAALSQVQSFLKSAYSRGHRISKITVTAEGHVVYVFANQAIFAGHAPEGANGFPIES